MTCNCVSFFMICVSDKIILSVSTKMKPQHLHNEPVRNCNWANGECAMLLRLAATDWMKHKLTQTREKMQWSNINAI